VADVAGLLEAETDHEATDINHRFPLDVCEGCDGSVCDSEPHRYRKVLPVPIVAAKPMRGKGDRR